MNERLNGRINGAKDGHISYGQFIADLLHQLYEQELSTYLSISCGWQGELTVDGVDCTNWR